MHPDNAPDVTTWSGKCLNIACPNRQEFAVKISAPAVCYMVCKTCQMRHSLKLKEAIVEFRMDKTEFGLFI